MQVLVIEDDDDVTLLYRLALQGAGHVVETVHLGSEGVRRAAERVFDIIVLDGMLPDLDGLEVLASLQSQPSTAGVPVVMASARVGSSDRAAALAAGATAYVVKPFEPSYLVDVVADVMGQPVGAGPRAPLVVPAVITSGAQKAAPNGSGGGSARPEGVLAQVLALAFDAIVSIDDEQRIVGFNKGAEDTFGYLAEEVLGKPLVMLMPERFSDGHRDHVQSFADGRVSGRLMGGQRVVFGRRRDGSEFPAEASITKLEIEGRPVLTAILRDATERQRTEADLRTRAEQQAAVAELGLRAIMATTLTNLLDDAVGTLGRVLEVDLVKLALLDPSGDELFLTAGLGWPPGAVGHVRCAAGTGTLAGVSLDKDEPIVFRDLFEDQRFAPDALLVEAKVVSGVHVTLRGRVRPVGLVGVYSRTQREFTDDDVHVVQAIANVVSSAVLRDAHERRQRSLLDAAPDATLVVDPSGRIVSANSQAEVLFGYSRDELMRLGVDSLVPEAVRSRHQAHRHSFEAERRPRAMGEGLELAARRRDGSTVPVDIMLRPYDTDEGAFVVAAIRDVTDRRRNEVARDAFLHAVSHELRTPLTAVLGFSSLLTDHFADAMGTEPLDLIHRIRSSATKLDRLLTDLLDLDRLGRGVLEAQRRDVELRSIVDHATEAVQLDGRELSVVVDPPDLVAHVDGAQVERMIENLVVNAVRHTPSGSHIEVMVRRSTNGVLIVVEDDGPGVALGVRDAIFEPFKRDARTAPGTGIGLSLVARFAELHGGRAWVEEREGGGASFRVVLSI